MLSAITVVFMATCWSHCSRIYNKFVDVRNDSRHFKTSARDKAGKSARNNPWKLLRGGRETSNSPSDTSDDELPNAFISDEDIEQVGFISFRTVLLDGSDTDWTRYYFVMAKSDLFFYSTSKAFNENRSMPKSLRPFSLAEFTVLQLPNTGNVDAPILEFRSSSEDEGRMPFQLKFDTDQEAVMWTTKFLAVCCDL
jgi:hypothetical protein